MKKMAAILAGCAAMALTASGALADAAKDAKLVIDGQTLVTKTAAPEGHPLKEVMSGWLFRTPATRALEMDDFANPAFIFIDGARDLWSTAEGTAGKSCESCHGAVEESMKGVRAGMPKMNADATDLWSMENFINNCRVERMGAEPWKWDKEPMNGMVALIGLQSRGMPVKVETGGPAAEWFERGKELYYTRFGQLQLACSNCHEDHYGDMIRADHLSQGQTNGFPTYRLKNTRLNSIQGRIKGCIRDTRAETFALGSPELRALELYVAWRGTGLSVETPSVRQ